jgi:hypothetical protein
VGKESLWAVSMSGSWERISFLVLVCFPCNLSCKVAREVVGGPRGPIVIIVEVIQCKVD